MPSYGSSYADRRIRYVDSRLRKEYQQAEKELEEKLDEFLGKSTAKSELKKKQVEAGLITQEAYNEWMVGQTFQKERWNSKVKQVQEVMYEHNVEAAKIVHENKVDVFVENYNYSAYEAEQATGITFDAVNEETVSALIKKNPQLLPEWEIDKEKDYKWNYRKVNNSITQGIIQGESVDQIKKRLITNLCTQNKNKMRMFARTAITGAENAGRQAQMQDVAEEGIEVKKEWVATLDSRTRDTHRRLDGQQVPVDKEFNSDLGKIMFPGDPTANPANVYNCRCAMITVFPKYQSILSSTPRRAYGKYTDSDGKTHRYSYLTQNPESYAEWKKSKKKKAAIENAQTHFTNDADWLKIGAKAGSGKVIEPDRHTSNDYQHELKIAKEINKTFGGDIELLSQEGRQSVADFRWKGQDWELKHPSSMNAVNDRTRDATTKMKKIGGNIILDIEVDDIEEAINIVQRRILRSAPQDCHIMIFHKGAFYTAWEYKK